ncbi:MAG: alkaline phosphatase family protein [Deltaproteobacteria bacterium]|nr:alkaline phosphatase family protein [Deltaproteobacteria bacterium]
MKRRDALKTMGALAGAAAVPKFLGGCGNQDGGETGITTVVTVMMENRSYDHYMGARSWLEGMPGNGLSDALSNPRRSGELVSPYRETDLALDEDPPHEWSSSRLQWNDGANDGFVTQHQNRFGSGVAPHPMGYLTREELPFLYAMADVGASCDAWYSSVMGPTWPNRMYLLSGQSNGRTNNDFPTGGGFDWPTVFHQLDDAGIEWTFYYNDLPFLPLWKGIEPEGRVKRFFPDFFEDAEAGALPPVVFIDPDFGVNDDHPPHHPILGQQFLASIYASLASSPQWKNILFTITYDEHGGFYDHVAPPTTADDYAAQGFDQLGFRVPTVAIGPYVREGHVSSVVRDHTSVLAHLAAMHGLDPLTARQAAANDLSELLDLEALAAGKPRKAPELPAVEVPESLLRAAVLDRRSHPVDLELAADAGHIPDIYDRRSNRDKLDALYGIGEVLDKLGRGRVVRSR